MFHFAAILNFDALYNKCVESLILHYNIKMQVVAMATKGHTELVQKLFDFLEMPTAAHYKSW